ncbi:unnamed protein product [Cylindrotheca closterium]|uniref:VWFA domain-containing protein n=1 Tax=Cylindrotheca closterium TaxID=2856 RepID=A0AAD2FHF8_9STRA|nr:unnamed protein product [Cylindrotheca closterium]
MISNFILVLSTIGYCVLVEAFSSPNPVNGAPVQQASSGIDQLLTQSLLASSTASIHVGGLTTASNGVQIWRHALAKGRAPTDYDFSIINEPWPAEPLYSAVCQKLLDLELPRFALRHPETITSILISLIRITIQYMETTHSLNRVEEDTSEEMSESSDGYQSDNTEEENAIDTFSFEDARVDLDEIAEEISNLLSDEWSGVIGGVSILDQLFGFDHGLLSVSTTSDLGSANSFGLQDGIWQNTGWQVVQQLQAEISNMPELLDFLKVIGRRPTVENSDKMQLFSPRKPKADGSMGAQFDPIEKDFMNGLTYSDSFSEMLPSEAMLLRGSHPVLRRLFLAKKVQSKLLSYQMSGWADIPSIPQTRPIYTKRLPSAPGGPITLCLDTSYSMEGRREILSKAVVLACVSQAHKQGRRCQVVAFSNERDVMESGEITADPTGIHRLLEFLSHSFGGGTDVTGALKHVMKTLDNDEMADADIVLISDGEIPDPPIPLELMTQLESLTVRRGVQVHGLLVGKQESIPLSKICSETYDFLFEYESMGLLGGSHPRDVELYSTPFHSSSIGRSGRTRNFFNSRRTQRRGGAIAAKRPSYDDDGGRRTKKRKGEFDDDDEDYVNGWDDKETEVLSTKSPNASLDSGQAYLDEVNKAVQILNDQAKSFVNSKRWNEEQLVAERNDEQSCWRYQPKLQAAIDMIGEGLVERQDESRLVVLSMLADEHILLLGVPGTGKSVLGRRLARLCNGRFFQRLLTRFTTPDELFGPLSLQALENDEYRRCTAGFLPTATVAFLDEIFKANSAILNTLLTILNERKFDNAGGQEDCPIRCVVGASNELPESDELVALYDRFLIRKEVTPVSDEGVMTLLSLRNPAGTAPCDSNDQSSCDVLISNDLQEITDKLSTAANLVAMEDHVCRVIVGLRTYLRDELSVQISDRRLLKAAQLLRLSAASHGRQNVDTVDCLLLQHCMWQLPEEKKSVTEWLLENLTPGTDMQQFRYLLENLRKEIQTSIRKTSGDISGDYGAREADLTVIEDLRKEIEKIVALLQWHHKDLLRHIQLLQDSSSFLWIDPEELMSAKQLMLPRAEALSVQVEKVLIDAVSLQLSITNEPNDISPEHRLSVIEELWDEEAAQRIQFTKEELDLDMREAKAKYDLETFRSWKRAKKKAQK